LKKWVLSHIEAHKETYTFPSPPAEQVQLDDHASDVFQALIEFPNERTTNNAILFLRFVWLPRRCHRKIKYRLRADEKMLGKPLVDLLIDGMSSFSDVLEEEWLTTSHPMHNLLDTFCIPFRPLASEETREYLFSSDTILSWCDLFATALKRLKEKAASCDMSADSIDDLNKSFQTVSSLLYDRVLEKILALLSLSMRIKAAMAHETSEWD
jgi:hypothetical protein